MTSAEVKRARFPLIWYATLNASIISSFVAPNLMALRPNAVAPYKVPISTSIAMAIKSLNLADNAPSEKVKSCKFFQDSISLGSNSL